ncbi:MAG: Asp-tRNA(Asn)/Glu-tRNA(Gln) amidotransferase subunit GatB [bacterium]
MAAQNIFLIHPEYEAVIGIETHVQLKTNSKIFCSCPNKFGDQPNTNICQICCGHPGVLPILNKKVVDFAILAGLATRSTICSKGNFARKHYFYPDLPKNYQITQDKTPICSDGYLLISTLDGTEKKVRIMRMHMEEDAGKNIHTSIGSSLVDLNRAGTPLLEIVTHPDISNAHEAKSYLTRLHNLVRYLQISDANMEQGSFRADVNISVKKKSDSKLGTRAEVKNINSFKYITQAIDFEIERQIKLLESGEKIVMQTRLWDSKTNQTYAMRSKEDATDYRYFTEPDLPELVIDQEWIDKIKHKIPELPDEKLARLQKEYNISIYEAEILINDKILADFFEETAQISQKPKLVCNWILRDLLGYLKEHKQEITESLVTPELLAELVTVIDTGIINTKTAQTVFAEMADTGKAPSLIIKEKNLGQIGSQEDIEKIILEVIQANPENVAKYRAGNLRVFTFFVGEVMKATKGKANPKIITEILTKNLI